MNSFVRCEAESMREVCEIEYLGKMGGGNRTCREKDVISHHSTVVGIVHESCATLDLR